MQATTNVQVSKVDLHRLENVARALKRGKYDLDGEEVLAFAQAMSWVGEMIGRVDKALKDMQAASEVKSDAPQIPRKPRRQQAAAPATEGA